MVHRFRSLITNSSIVVASLCGASSFAQEAKEDKDPWTIRLGAGYISRPEFPGSDNQKEQFLPLITVRYKQFFLGGLPGLENGIGAYLHEGDHWTVAAAIAQDVDEPRDESDDEFLQGLGDIEPTTHGGIYVGYKYQWLTLRTIALTDLADEGHGTTVNMSASASFSPLPKLILSVTPGITWADEEHMQTYFGVNEEQSINSGREFYSVSSGVSRLRLSMTAIYRLSEHWGIGANYTATQLQDEASDSPIIQRDDQNAFGLFLTYRF